MFQLQIQQMHFAQPASSSTMHAELPGSCNLSFKLYCAFFHPFFHFVHQWLPTPVLTLLTKSTETPALRPHQQIESQVWPVSLIGNGGLSCDWKGYETLRRFSFVPADRWARQKNSAGNYFSNERPPHSSSYALVIAARNGEM